MSICFIQVLPQFQQPFSHIVAVFGYGKELDTHFESVALLKYQSPDTSHDISLVTLYQHQVGLL